MEITPEHVNHPVHWSEGPGLFLDVLLSVSRSLNQLHEPLVDGECWHQACGK